MDALTQYLEQNRRRFLDDLQAALRIPSVSAQPAHAADVRRCAEHIAAHLRSIGMTHAEVVDTQGHPVVYGEWLGAPGALTMLLYGHYDVQPPEPLELWHTPPFEPTERDGKLYARGACDDKGQVYMHLSAIAAHFAVNGRLPVNVKLVIEGEEEVGSEHLEAFLRQWQARLAADVIVVSDTSMLGPDQPSLCYALRGLVYAEVEVTGPARDLHSGEFGGAVMNPANALSVIIAGLKDGDGRVTVKGFYDSVRPLTDLERTAMRELPFDEAGFIRESGAPGPFGEKGFSTLERVTARPTLDVNGMWSGYTGPGAKTVLPSFAAAKISMRLVADQETVAIYRAFEARVRELAPSCVTVKVTHHHSALPFITDPGHPMMQAAWRALARSWSKPPSLIREGGSIPVMAAFQKVLGLPSILMGFGLHDDQVHAPNEKFSLTSFHGGTKSCAYLYEEIPGAERVPGRSTGVPSSKAIADEALIALRATARPASDHPASGGWGSRMERLGLTTDECLSIAREVQRHCGGFPPRAVVAVALALVETRVFDARQVAYNLLRLHPGAARSLRAADLGVLGRGMDNWVSVDSFGCWVSGPAWRDGQIDDARVHRWVASPDRWWRRAALVSTIPLNLASKGGHGDTPRTLTVCDRLAADHDDMVEKALSWALRELAKRDPDAVRRFLSRRVADVAARVRREVTAKLETGLKHPRGPQPGQRRAAPRRAGR